MARTILFTYLVGRDERRLSLFAGDLSLSLTQFCARLKTVLFCKAYETLT